MFVGDSGPSGCIFNRPWLLFWISGSKYSADVIVYGERGFTTGTIVVYGW